MVFAEGLLGRCIRATGSLAAGSFVENALRFARNIILARIITPEAFGLMATITAATGALEAFTEVGLRQSIIQNKKGAEEEFLNVAWWISAFRALALYVIAYYIAPFIATFFDKPEATQLLRIGFIVILFNGCISPRVHVLEKHFRFKAWVILTQGSGAVGVVLAIVAGFLLQNVWALVLGYVSEAFLRFFFSFVICPLKPRIRFGREHAKEILRYSRGMFGLPILMMLLSQADVFVIGRVLSLGQLGLYTLAKSLAEMPLGVISKVAHPVILPAFSEMQDDKEKLKKSLVLTTGVIATFGIPLAAFLALWAGPILTVVYGPIYSKVATPFGILSVYAILLTFSSLIMAVYLAVGSPAMQRNAALVRTGVLLILIYPATESLGLIGSSAAVFLAASASLAVQLFYVKRVVELSFPDYLKSLRLGVKPSLVVLVPGLFTIALARPLGLLGLILGMISCLLAWVIGLRFIWSLRDKSGILPGVTNIAHEIKNI